MKKSMCAFLSILLITLLAACSPSLFSGSRTGNDSQLIMKYTILNGTESQMLKLEKGDMIAAEIVSDSGTLDIIIQQDGEDPIYQGSGVPTSTFEVEVEKSGRYKISVIGKSARGSVSFTKNSTV